MMRFKDYPIKILEHGNWFNHTVGEKVEETLLRINNWVEEKEHIVLNIETLFFPELDEAKGGTGTPLFKAGGGETKSEYYQVFRVWYKVSHKISNTDVEDLV